MPLEEYKFSPGRNSPEIDQSSKCSPSNNSLNEDQTNAKGLAATRAARTRDWPERSDVHEHFSSLHGRINTQKEVVVITTLGMDSGRNLFGIFDDFDDKPRLKYNVQIRNGRPKNGWPAYNNPKDTNLPVGASLKQICTYFPAHCWGDGLRLFIAEGWTAQDIWDALPKDARNSGAHVRPWNYLQQAMGREVDKMRVEGGLPQRKIAKRKHAEVDDEHNEVQPGHVSPLSLPRARQLTKSRGTMSVSSSVQQHDPAVTQAREFEATPTSKRPRYDDPIVSPFAIPGIEKAQSPTLGTKYDFFDNSESGQGQAGPHTIFKGVSAYGPAISQSGQPVNRVTAELGWQDSGSTRTTQPRVSLGCLQQPLHNPGKQRLYVSENGSPEIEPLPTLGQISPPPQRFSLIPAPQTSRQVPPFQSSPLTQQQPAYPSPEQAFFEQHQLGSSVSPEEGVWKPGFWPSFSSSSSSYFDPQMTIIDTSNDPFEVHFDSLKGINWNDFDVELAARGH